jgi:O-antigen/teichoic acid export membrane protein
LWSHAAELSWLCAGQAVSLILGILTIKLLTSMGPSNYGTYALVGTIGALVSSILYGPLEQGFVRFYYDYANRGMARRFINLFYRCLFVGCGFCVVGGLVVVFADSWTGTHLSSLLIFSATLFVILSSTANPFNSMLNVLRRRRENALLQMLERLLALLFLFAIFQITTRTLTTALLALCLALALVVTAKSVLLSSLQPADETSGASQQHDGHYAEMLKAVRRFGAPFAIWGLAGWLQSNSERWVILTYLSAADVGIYAVMMALANYAVAVPQGILSQFAVPFIYERFSGSAGATSRREGSVYLGYFVLSSAILVGLVALAAVVSGKSAIIILSSEQYARYWYLLPLLCLGTGLFHVGQALCLVGLSLNLPNKYMFPKIAAGLLAVLLNILFVNLFGMHGIAVSICVAGLVYLLMIVAVNAKIKATSRRSETGAL